MKFEVGNKVSRRHGLKLDKEYEGWNVIEDMLEGSPTMTIRGIYNNPEERPGYLMNEVPCVWTDPMLEPFRGREILTND